MKIKKTVALLLILALVLSGCAAGAEETVPVETTEATVPPTTLSPETEPPATEPEPSETEPPEEYFYLTFAGDCTFGGEPVIYYAPWGFLNTVGEDYGWPFRNVMEWFGNDDFTMVNLEGVLCDSGNPVDKKFTFRGPTAFVNILTQNSVEAVTLANNHSMDYGGTAMPPPKPPWKKPVCLTWRRLPPSCIPPKAALPSASTPRNIPIWTWNV